MSVRSRRLFPAAMLLAAELVSLAVLSAQSATGDVEGQVVDASGGVLPGVSVSLTHVATGAVRSVLTGDDGFFRVPVLPVGAYELLARLDGFDAHRQTALTLTVGQTVTLRIELRVAGVAQEVTVAGQTPILERTRTRVSSTVENVAIQNLPVNGRNFLDFVLLTSGVTRDARLGDLSFAGQRGTLNSLVVDGADNNNTFAGQTIGRTGSGRVPYQFSIDAVEEFQVNAIGYPAEYGRAGGGVINVVTKSGTNRVAGSLFEFYRDKALNATNSLNRRDGLPKSPYHYHQFGGTAGGPFRPNRDFFFFNYDGQRNTQPNDVSLPLPPSLPADESTRAGLERLSALARSWTRRLDQNVFLLKTDHYIGNASRLSIRYNHHDFNGVNFESGGPQMTVDHTGDSLVRTRTLNLSWSRPFRHAHNEFRFQYARDDAEGTANSDQPEAIIRQGGVPVLVIGRNFFSPRRTTIDRVQFADVATWLRGEHTLKGGVDVQFDRIDNFFPGYFAGSYQFQSLASFQRGRPDGPGEFYRQSFPGPGTSGAYSRPDVREYSAFFQDEWKARPDLTLSAGVRYDVMNTAAPPLRNTDPELAAAAIDTSSLESDLDNVAPRLGIAWSPEGRRFVFRGGLGVFYGRTPAITATAAHGTNGVNIQSMTFTGSSVPTYPQRFTDNPAGGVLSQPTVIYVARGFENPRVVQAHAAIDQQLSQNTVVTFGYQYAHGSDLTQAVDRNVGSEGVRTFTVTNTGERVSYPFLGVDRPFRNFGRVIAITSAAESRYHGITVDLHRRFAGDFLLRTAYTLGNVTDTGPNTVATEDFNFPANPTDPEADRARGANDQPHRFVASGVYSTNGLAKGMTGLPHVLTRGWYVSAILTAQSGLPYSARSGNLDLNNDGNTSNDLAPGTRRNQFRLPSTTTLDTRLARSLRLGGADVQVIWEAFNVLNRTNIVAVRSLYYDVALPALTLTRNTSFGRPVFAGEARIMQLAAKLTF